METQTQAGVEVTRVGAGWRWAFPASWLAVGSKPDGGGIVTPIPVEDYLSVVKGAALAANGPQFSFVPGEARDPDPVDQGYRTAPHYLAEFGMWDRARGVDVPPRQGRERDGCSILVRGGVATGVSGWPADPHSYDVALQLFPSIVLRGAAAGVRDIPDRSGKGALAILGDGRVAVFGGPWSIFSLRDACLAGGAVHAGYLDGGGSWRVEMPGRPVWGGSKRRRVGALVVAAPPGAGSSIGPGSIALAAIAGAAGVLAWSERGRILRALGF